jgi:hypothetical protein
VSVEPFHLFRYLDEQVYRFKNRKMTDAERFDLAVRGIVGKRLTFDQLSGKTATEASRHPPIVSRREGSDRTRNDTTLR